MLYLLVCPPRPRATASTERTPPAVQREMGLCIEGVVSAQRREEGALPSRGIHPGPKRSQRRIPHAQLSFLNNRGSHCSNEQYLSRHMNFSPIPILLISIVMSPARGSQRAQKGTGGQRILSS